MTPTRRTFLAGLAAMPFAVGGRTRAQTPAVDPLPSWTDGLAKAAILDFVARTTKDGGPDFVPPPERVAAFDNDGTLWCEQPMYVQAAFVLDRIKALAPRHPEWRTAEPFKSVLDGNLAGVVASSESGLAALVGATHAGMTAEAFEAIVSDWLKAARHPRFKEPYTACVYRPMVELLAHLRANGYKTYIVSGGGADFMRPWADRAYGIPPEQVIGSTIATEYEVTDGKPAIVRLPKIEFIDDHAGKPVGIHRHIGRRPAFAAGNSDGDREMLEWTTAGPGPRFGLLVHHTDAEREYAYDRKSAVGRLDKALDQAAAAGWTVADMKRDWKRVFAFEG